MIISTVSLHYNHGYVYSKMCKMEINFFLFAICKEALLMCSMSIITLATDTFFSKKHFNEIMWS